jgi:CRP-like cAMP-binding protein
MNERLLDHIARHVTLDLSEQELLFNTLVLKKLNKNQYLLKEGAICKYDYFVIQGGVRQYEVDKNGKELIIHFGFEDWWISDKASFWNEIPSIYNIEALEDTSVLQVKKEHLEKLFSLSPKLEHYFHLVLQHTFAIWQNKILFLQKPAEERYRLFREMYGHIEQRISQQHIASYLGVTRETLSRLRSQLFKKAK